LTISRLLLQGHIALARAVFPEGTIGSRIDCLARVPLWTAGLDYNHGTGHGVGAFLNVHEGPQGIGFRFKENEMVSDKEL
jgi:Xaa-Pro aminopeptidase